MDCAHGSDRRIGRIDRARDRTTECAMDCCNNIVLWHGLRHGPCRRLCDSLSEGLFFSLVEHVIEKSFASFALGAGERSLLLGVNLLSPVYCRFKSPMGQRFA